jgi:8-oxo-dGTP diphosphatase
MSWNLTKGVSAAVLRGNNILMIRREKDPFKGYWCLPGGKIRPNETIEEAMIREVREETGYLLDRRVSALVAINRNY